MELIELPPGLQLASLDRLQNRIDPVHPLGQLVDTRSVVLLQLCNLIPQVDDRLAGLLVAEQRLRGCRQAHQQHQQAQSGERTQRTQASMQPAKDSPLPLAGEGWG